MTKILLLVAGFLVSTTAHGKALNPSEFNECVYSYWGARLKSGVIDAQAAHDVAKAALYPSVSGNIDTQNDFLANPQPGAFTGAYVSLSQQIINISNWAAIHAKSVGEKAAFLDFEDQLLTLMKTATKTYFDFVRSEKRLAILRKRVTRLTRGVALAKETRRLRLTDSSAVYLAQGDKVRLDISITRAEADMAALLSSLGVAVGQRAGSLELDGEYEPEISGDFSYWMKKVDELPAIQALKAKADASGATATSARELALPILSLSGYVGQTPATVGTTPGGSAVFVLSVGIPIFDQGLHSIQAQQADSQKTVAEAQTISKRVELLSEVKNLLTQWQADEKILKMSKDQLDNAQQAYDALVTLFSYGKSNFTAVKDAETNLVEAEIELQTVQKKIAEEKTILELFDKYSGGRHRPLVGALNCPGLN